MENREVERLMEEVMEALRALSEKQNAQYTDIMLALRKLAEDLERRKETEGDLGGFEEDSFEDNELYEEAKEIIIRTGKASTAILQRRLKLGYARAARMLDLLEERGVVGPGVGAKPREVLLGKNAPMEKLRIENSRGEYIAAVIHRPIVAHNRLAILCPGYLDTKDYPHLVDLAEKLAEQGYDAVRFDPTGTWESEGDISEYTTTQYLADIESVLNYMLGKGEYSHVLLGGHSRGGQVSILFAAENPRIDLVLGIMPSLGRMEESEREKWKEAGERVSERDLPNSPKKKVEFQVPFSHVEDREQYDTLEAVKKVRVPFVLIAGELDEVVEPAEVKEIFDAANMPKKFILIEKIGHDYRRNRKEVDLVNKKIIESLG